MGSLRWLAGWVFDRGESKNEGHELTCNVITASGWVCERQSAPARGTVRVPKRDL
jgi:hypothetical protein